MKSKEVGATNKNSMGEENMSISNIIKLMVAMQVQADLTLKGLELLKCEWVKKVYVKP